MKKLNKTFILILTSVMALRSPITVMADEVPSKEIRLAQDINEYRVSCGLQELQTNEELNEIAAIRSEEVSKNLSHIRPNGKSVEQMIPGNVYKGENISYASITGNPAEECDLMIEIMKSSYSHNDNLLAKEYNKIGISTYECDGMVYAVYVFSS